MNSDLKIHAAAKRDYAGILGSFVMAAFMVLAVQRWLQSGSVFFLLLGFRNLLSAIYLSIRKPAIATGTGVEAFLSYITCMVPLLYFGRAEGISVGLWGTAEILAVIGYLLATLALIELGNCFGVAPAHRGAIRKTGIYRVLKHPMYTGYALAEFGQVLVNPLNFLVFALSMGLQLFRVRAENRVLRA